MPKLSQPCPGLPIAFAPGIRPTTPDLRWYDTVLHGLRQASLHQQTVLGLPFDLAREHYSKAVRAGLVEKSLIASARVERTISAMEACVLGPWAR